MFITDVHAIVEQINKFLDDKGITLKDYRIEQVQGCNVIYAFYMLDFSQQVYNKYMIIAFSHMNGDHSINPLVINYTIYAAGYHIRGQTGPGATSKDNINNILVEVTENLRVSSIDDLNEALIVERLQIYFKLFKVDTGVYRFTNVTTDEEKNAAIDVEIGRYCILVTCTNLCLRYGDLVSHTKLEMPISSLNDIDKFIRSVKSIDSCSCLFAA